MSVRGFIFLLHPVANLTFLYIGLNVILATGDLEPPYDQDPNKLSEIINFRKNHINCENIEQYPLDVSGAAGANFESTPVICGGQFQQFPFFDNSGHCYAYKDYKWQPFAQMVTPRSYAAAIIYNNSLHIFGGLDPGIQDWNEIKSSEIISHVYIPISR